jgi:hypothetical protein
MIGYIACGSFFLWRHESVICMKHLIKVLLARSLPLLLITILFSGCLETLEDVQDSNFRPRGEAVLTVDGHLFIQAHSSFLEVDLPKEFAKFSAPGATVQSVSRHSLSWKDYIPGNIPTLPDGRYKKIRIIMDWSTIYERDQSRIKMAEIGSSHGDVLYLYDFRRENHRAWMHFRLYSKSYEAVSPDFLVEVPVKVTHRIRQTHING